MVRFTLFVGRMGQTRRHIVKGLSALQAKHALVLRLRRCGRATERLNLRGCLCGLWVGNASQRLPQSLCGLRHHQSEVVLTEADREFARRVGMRLPKISKSASGLTVEIWSEWVAMRCMLVATLRKFRNRFLPLISLTLKAKKARATEPRAYVMDYIF